MYRDNNVDVYTVENVESQMTLPNGNRVSNVDERLSRVDLPYMATPLPTTLSPKTQVFAQYNTYKYCDRMSVTIEGSGAGVSG